MFSLFKNYKSKKQLRKEIEYYKDILNSIEKFKSEYKIIPVKTTIIKHSDEIDDTKIQLADELFNLIKSQYGNLIEYDIKETSYDMTEISATILLAKNKTLSIKL